MRILVLICFPGMSLLSVQAQKDSVQLVDIQSSECGGIYLAEPHFLNKETIGDTTFIRLSGSNNCKGFHNPIVSLRGDSVCITIPPGEKRVTYKIKRKRKVSYVNESDLKKMGLENYRDSIHLKEETIIQFECDCCFTFDLKLVGLDPSEEYKYFYNNLFVDPNYLRKEPEVIELR